MRRRSSNRKQTHKDTVIGKGVPGLKSIGKVKAKVMTMHNVNSDSHVRTGPQRIKHVTMGLVQTHVLRGEIQVITCHSFK